MKTITLIEQVKMPMFDDAVHLAKIDTGASNGALHAEDIQLNKDAKGQYILSFRPFGGDKVVKKDCFRTIRVRSSNGIQEQRFSILTDIEIAGDHHKIRITLSNRSKMKYEIIIGQEFLKGKYVINPIEVTA